MSDTKEKEETITYLGVEYKISECVKIGGRILPKGELVPIAGINFLRSGMKNQTRENFNLKFGGVEVNGEKNPNGHTKTMKQLDSIWKQLKTLKVVSDKTN